VWYDGMGHEDQGKCSCLLFSYKRSAIWRTYPLLTTYVDLMFHFSSAWNRMMMRETIGVVKGAWDLCAVMSKFCGERLLRNLFHCSRERRDRLFV